MAGENMGAAPGIFIANVLSCFCSRQTMQETWKYYQFYPFIKEVANRVSTMENTICTKSQVNISKVFLVPIDRLLPVSSFMNLVSLAKAPFHLFSQMLIVVNGEEFPWLNNRSSPLR
jgi:hypothetical protein